MQTLTNPQVLEEPFAEEGIKNVIPTNPTGTYNASLKEGFPAITMTPIASGGEPPVGADFNGVFNMMSNYHYFLQNGGQETFRQEVSDAIGGYPENAILWYLPTGELKALPVVSLIPNNTYDFNTDPTLIDDVHWAYAITGNYVDFMTAQTITATKTFTAAPLVPTQATSDDSQKAASTAYVKDILEVLYPVGSIYIGIQSTCPLATLLPGSAWTQIQGRYLLASGTIAGTIESVSAGNTCSAGAPNIYGYITDASFIKNPTYVAQSALYCNDWHNDNLQNTSGQGDGAGTLQMDASRHNSVYGVSATIRPAGYAVNVWVRTA